MPRKRALVTTTESPTDPDVVRVIDRTALIENLLNQVIIGFCRPRNDAWEFMWSVVLDTSVMSLGAKLRVAMATAGEMNLKLDKDALHDVLAMRNAFAHHSSTAHPVLTVGATPDDDRIYNQLWILGTSGNITRKERAAALAEFERAYESARKSLMQLNEAIRAKYTSAA